MLRGSLDQRRSFGENGLHVYVRLSPQEPLKVLSLGLFCYFAVLETWHPTPVFLPGESQGRGNLVGCRVWGRAESDMTEAT